MIRIAIVDDVDFICEQIENFLREFSKKKSIEISFDTYYSGEETEKALKSNYYDCIFLDIEIGKINGIDVSRYLREELDNKTTEIIYISQHRQYAADLFDFDPVMFLLKPINETQLLKTFIKFLKRLKINEEVFAFKVGRDLQRIPLKDIIYFESNDHKVEIHTHNNKINIYDQIERISVFLKKQRFLHIHKSFVVNSRHIQKYGYETLTLDNGEELAIAQSKRKEIREWQLQNDSDESGWFSW